MEAILSTNHNSIVDNAQKTKNLIETTPPTETPTLTNKEMQEAKNEIDNIINNLNSIKTRDIPRKGC